MTFRTIKNFGLGLLLIILLLVVAFAQTRNQRAAAALERVISRDIPAQIALAEVRDLIAAAKLRLVSPTTIVEPEPSTATSARAQLSALRSALAEAAPDAPALAEIDALLATDDAEPATDALRQAVTALRAMADTADWPQSALSALADLAERHGGTTPSADTDPTGTDARAAFADLDKATARLAQLRDSLDGDTDMAIVVTSITPAISTAQDYRDTLAATVPADAGTNAGLPLAAEDVRVLALRLDERLQTVDSRLRKQLRARQIAALETSQADRRWFIWVALGSIGLAAIISLVFSRVLSARIEAVVTATRRFSGGDLSWRLPIRGDDELGRLGGAFNEMAEGLRALVGNVHLAGIQVTGAATEIAATMKQQETSANEQAATASEIAASTREIASTSDTLLANVAQVSHVAQDVAGLGAESAAGLSRMETTMNQMADASRDIAEKLAVLNEKAGTISSVVTTINKVADQTNLLSLNAAIEAEKAGEYGLGFGVVAKEIRRLADQTAVATWDIEQVVKEIQSAVSAGVMGMERFTEEVRQGVDEIATAGEQLSGIVGQVQTLAPHFETVHEGMQSQTQGAEQINQAIAQLSDTVGSAAEAMHESERVVVQLNEAASRLQQAVGNFKLRD